MSSKAKGRARKVENNVQENVIDSVSDPLNNEGAEQPDEAAVAENKKKQPSKRKQSAPAKKIANNAEPERVEELPAKRGRGKQSKAAETEKVVEDPIPTRSKRGAAKKVEPELVEKPVKVASKSKGKVIEKPLENGSKAKGRGKVAVAVEKMETDPIPMIKQDAKGVKRAAASKKGKVDEIEAENDDLDPPITKKGRGGKSAAAAATTSKAKPEPEETDAVNGLEIVKRGRGRKGGKASAIDESTPPPAEPIEDNGTVVEKPAKRGAPRKAAAATSATTAATSATTAAAKKRGTTKRNLTPTEEIAKVNGDHDEEEKEGDHEEIITAAKKRKASTKPIPAKDQNKKLNATDTDYSKLDFSSDKEFNFKISSWNIAGMRAWIKKGGLEYVDHEKPDILCLQEIKCIPDDIPDEARLPGYHPYWLCKPGGHAGVAIYSKIMPINVEYGIGDDEQDEDGRILTAEYEKFYLVCVYVPNAGRKLVTLPKRLRWNKLFEAFVKKLNDKKPVIICGDMNVAHNENDLANPKTNKKNAGFTQEERDGMTDLLSLGFVDTLRHFYPDKERAFTFWAYFMNSRAKDVGWRLDYFLISERLMSKCVDNVIRSKVLGSDHCPISLLLSI